MTTDTCIATAARFDNTTLHPVYRARAYGGGRSLTMFWRSTSGWAGPREVEEFAARELDARLDYVARHPEPLALLVNGDLAAEDSYCLEMARTPAGDLQAHAAEIAAARPGAIIEIRRLDTEEEIWELWSERDARRGERILAKTKADREECAALHARLLAEKAERDAHHAACREARAKAA